MLPWISCKIALRFKRVNIGGFFYLTNKSDLIVVLCKTKATILRWKKIMKGKNVMKSKSESEE